jgi:hypothetical protein
MSAEMKDGVNLRGGCQWLRPLIAANLAPAEFANVVDAERALHGSPRVQAVVDTAEFVKAVAERRKQGRKVSRKPTGRKRHKR